LSTSDIQALVPGIEGRAQWTVAVEHLASTWGSGLVDVLATPTLVGFCEEVARQSVRALLPPGKQTVGTLVHIEHLAATPLGMKVTVQSKLVEIDGRRLTFVIEANDERELVARCEHQRFIIEQERFSARISEKSRLE